MNPVHQYYKRYIELKSEKAISTDLDNLQRLVEEDPAGLNNFYMAALGMSTLMLRLGAVIQLCQKFERLDDQGDALFMKQILDNLRESLPSDTSWKNLWALSAVDESWMAPIVKPKNGEPLLNRFITFNNWSIRNGSRI